MKPTVDRQSSVAGSVPELATRFSSILDRFESRKKAAEIAGVTAEQLGKYAKGKAKPPFEVAARLAVRAGVSLDWLATGAGEMTRTMVPAEELDAMALAGVPARDLREQFVLVPRYDVRASAGAGAVIHSEQIVDYLAFKAEWVHKALHVAPEALALIEAVGDSMETTISDGDLLLVNTSVPRIKDNAIYALNIDGDLIVKRVQRHLDGSLTVKSDNDRYKPEEVPASLAASLRVVGQVIWHGRMVR